MISTTSTAPVALPVRSGMKPNWAEPAWICWQVKSVIVLPCVWTGWCATNPGKYWPQMSFFRSVRSM